MDGAPDVLALLDRPGVRGVALEDAQYTVNYCDLGPAVRARAAMLARHGVSAGDRVAVMLPNCAASVEIYLACALLGAIWVGINPASPQAEQDRQCALVSPTMTVTAASLQEVDETATFDAAPPTPSVPCAIGFSSGTTGTPKALVHSRAGISLAAAALAAKSLRGGDRVGVILPMSIHNVMVVGPMAALFAGATTVAVDRMNAAGVAAACRDRQLTRVNALVPTTIYDLVHDDTIAPQTLASLRVAGTGAAGLSESLRSAFEAKFGVRLVGSYGMTEAPGVVSIEDPEVPHLPGACGTALPHLEISACDEQGRQLPAGREGELRVCAADSGAWADVYRPAIGAWGEHGLRRRSPREKCFCTGDYGWVDIDGTVHVSGRKSDVIVRGGVNVNAAELESVLGDIAEVREVAVVGEHDDRLGQRIVAFVEPASGATADAARLRQQARGLLSHGKVPDEFVVVEALPRNAMGKVARGQLMNRRIRQWEALTLGQLDGKVAVITGAGTGLGAATATLFAREGAAVTLVGRRAKKLKEVATAIESDGGRALVVPGDVAQPSTAVAAAEESIRMFGGVDVLINNAGLHATPYPLHETPIDEWDRFLAVDLTGPFLFTRAVLPSMMGRRDGAIVNIGSMVALVGFKGSTAYAAAKGGLVSMTRTTAVDYAPYGIRANCVCPGGMEPVEYGNLTAEQLAQLHEAVNLSGGALLNRLANVAEVAQFLLVLVGPNGRSLTGAVIPFDGGFTAK